MKRPSYDLAVEIRKNIDSYLKKIPFDDSEQIHNWKTLVEYIGSVFDKAENRRLAIEGNGFTKTVNTVLRKNRLEFLVKALKEHSPCDYNDF